MVIIAVLVGILLAYSFNWAFTGIVGALLAWLVVQVLRQQRRIDALEGLLQDAGQRSREPMTPPVVKAQDAGLDAASVAAAAQHAAAAANEALPPRASATPPGARVAAAGPSAVHSPAARVTTKAEAGASLPASGPGPLARWVDSARAWLLGGNTIVKAGVGILFLGLTFLAKYASEHVSVPVEWRLAGVASVALVLLALGWGLRHKRAAYAQVLQGGAVAVLYLTLFVALRYYEVLASGPVFVLMVVVAALAAALAVLQDAKALAVIGALGGFATPLLVSTGAGNHVALFGYYLVLNLGIAAVAWFRDWRALNLIGFFATFLVGSLWGVFKYRPDDFASSQAFLIANFLLFNAILLMPARRLSVAPAPGARADVWVNGTLLFGLPTIVFVLQHGLVRHIEFGTAISALVLAGFYVLMAWWMRARPLLALTFEASLAIAVIFLTLVIPFALDARSTAGAWALEGAGLVWLGLRQRRWLQRSLGYVLLLLAGLAMAWALEGGAPTQVFNGVLFNALIAAAATLAAALFVHRAVAAPGDAQPLLSIHESPVEPVLIAAGMTWLLLACKVQIDTFVIPLLAKMAWLSGVSAIALLCCALHRLAHWPRIALPALGLAPMMALVAVYSTLLMLSPTGRGGAWAWPLAWLAHGAVLRWAAPSWPARLQHAIHALGALTLASLLALQGRVWGAGWGDEFSAWPWLGWLVGPALLLWLLASPALSRHWPIHAASAAYRSTAAGLLSAGLLLWTLLANLDSSGAALPLPYLPLLNPLDVGVAVALVAAWSWRQSDGATAWMVGRQRAAWAVLGLFGFVWINAMLIRAFHHFGGVAFRFHAWVDSLAVQTGLTLLWSVTALALMWFSARRAMRAPWLAGAVLLGVVVLKLLLVDLSGAGTVTRIVSFIGVGVLMLVIGYVAPWPAKERRHAPS